RRLESRRYMRSSVRAVQAHGLPALYPEALHAGRQVDKFKLQIKLFLEMIPQCLHPDDLGRIVPAVDHVDAKVERIIELGMAGLAGHIEITAQGRGLLDILGPAAA